MTADDAITRAAEVAPDYDDPGWRDVQHNTRTLDCMGGEHDACALPRFCRCACHHPSVADVIRAHVGGAPNGGTAAGAWVKCRCGETVKGVSRDHAASKHHAHVAQALADAGLLRDGHCPTSCSCRTAPDGTPLDPTPEHDAQVAARALREAAVEVFTYAYQPGDGSTPPEDQAAGYIAGARDAHDVVDRLLRARADRIEGGDDADA